jgi:putative oxygen-independent coproporphyrinogen III oxidase
LKNKTFGVYVHWPFCLSKCPYCDFNSHVRASIDIERWEKALLADLLSFHEKTFHQTVTSIFFGGGTPSLMPPHMVENLIKKVMDLWPVSSDLEISLEANPTSVEEKKFSALATAGVNRVSLGVQSLKENGLKFLGRTHSVSEAKKAIETARLNFKRYSLDFIYTRPAQTLKEWEEELQEALSLANGHLSLYQLTIEEGTPFFLSFHRGDFQLPSNDQSALFYEHTHAITQAHGYLPYEISNYAFPQQECRHNMTYWQYEDYIGVGPGAHSRLTFEGEKYAIRRHRSPEKWVEDVFLKNDGTHEVHVIPWKVKSEELLMMGLRLTQGISQEDFIEQLGCSFTEALNADKLQKLIKENLLEISESRLKATKDGRQRLDGILRYLFEGGAEHES